MCNEQPELLDENEEAVGDKVPNVIVWYGSRNQPMYSHRLDSCKSKKKGNVFTHFYMHSAVHLSFYCYTNLVLVWGLNQLPRLLVGESKNKSCKKQVFQSKGEITRSNRISVYTRGPLLTLFFETKSRKPCKRRSDLVLNGQMRVPK